MELACSSPVTGHNYVSVTRQMGFHPPVTDDSVDHWDEWRCCCHHNPPAPIWPTQYTADMGCNLWPLHQWGDATSPISTEELVLWLYLLKVDEIWFFFLCSLQQTVKMPGSVWNSCAQYDAFAWRSGLMGSVMCLHLDVEPVGILLSSWQLQHVFLWNNISEKI